MSIFSGKLHKGAMKKYKERARELIFNRAEAIFNNGTGMFDIGPKRGMKRVADPCIYLKESERTYVRHHHHDPEGKITVKGIRV